MAKKTVIVTTTDRGYLPAACCTLYSAQTHLPDTQEISLALVCCDVDDIDITKSEKMFAARHMDVVIINAIEIAEKIKTIKSRRWPRAAYLRLYFDEIFGSDIDRLVYLDSDVRVMTDLKPLLEVNLHGKAAGAVHDMFYYITNSIGERRRMLFLDSDSPYLQSGVMVFDLPLTLELELFVKARDFLAQYPDRCVEAPDQDALNAVLKNQWVPIDPRWNLHEHYLQYTRRHQSFIEHYTGPKPWSRERHPAWKTASEWYRQQLADTDWHQFVTRPSFSESVKLDFEFIKNTMAARTRYFMSDYLPILLDWLGKPQLRKDTPQLIVPRSRKYVELMVDAEIEEAALGHLSLRPPEAVLGFSSQ